MDIDSLIRVAAEEIQCRLIHDLTTQIIQNGIDDAIVRLLRQEALQRFQAFAAARKDPERSTTATGTLQQNPPTLALVSIASQDDSVSKRQLPDSSTAYSCPVQTPIQPQKEILLGSIRAEIAAMEIEPVAVDDEDSATLSPLDKEPMAYPSPEDTPKLSNLTPGLAPKTPQPDDHQSVASSPAISWSAYLSTDDEKEARERQEKHVTRLKRKGEETGMSK